MAGFGQTVKLQQEIEKVVDEVGVQKPNNDPYASLRAEQESMSHIIKTHSFAGIFGFDGTGKSAIVLDAFDKDETKINDSVLHAVDFDNGKIYWHQNGTYISTSGGQQNPTTQANPITFTTGNDFWFPVIGSYSDNPTAQANFGNGYFGTTAVSSAGTNASGIGIFEYNVPAGFTALSTKGLNE